MNSKKILTIYMLGIGLAFSQNEGLFVSGNMQIHENGQLGIHTNLINEGVFNQNKGLAVFSSPTNISVSGGEKAIFHNVIVDVSDELELEKSMGITGELTFEFGKISTPRNNSDVSLDFEEDVLSINPDDFKHIDGYSKKLGGFNSGDFLFPLGDMDQYKPLGISEIDNPAEYVTAYFFEDPNDPTYINSSFDTNVKIIGLEKVNENEFWVLDGNTPTNVTLYWNPNSNIAGLNTNLNLIEVVGWSNANQRWENLGNLGSPGDLQDGSVTSFEIVPNDYAVFTTGSVSGDNVNTNGQNYVITPGNTDGLNDVLVIEEVNAYPENNLKIYNRWGKIVYSKDDYSNDWGGYSTHSATYQKDKILPTGTYFYFLTLKQDQGDDIVKQGWVYIN